MRAISLWQPWATAVALRLKKVETRHWTTNYRGRLAIHAAQRWGPDERRFAAIEYALGRLPARVPLGAIVATVMLVDVRSTTDMLAVGVDPVERIYGNYEPGRFGWVLEEIIALPEPIPFKGRQGFFNVPDELLPAIARQLVTPAQPQPAPMVLF